MNLKFTYKGRAFSSVQNDQEPQVRPVASSAGARVHKTTKGFEIEGTADQVARFRDRLRRG